MAVRREQRRRTEAAIHEGKASMYEKPLGVYLPLDVDKAAPPPVGKITGPRSPQRPDASAAVQSLGLSRSIDVPLDEATQEHMLQQEHRNAMRRSREQEEVTRRAQVAEYQAIADAADARQAR